MKGPGDRRATVSQVVRTPPKETELTEHRQEESPHFFEQGEMYAKSCFRKN